MLRLFSLSTLSAYLIRQGPQSVSSSFQVTANTETPHAVHAVHAVYAVYSNLSMLFAGFQRKVVRALCMTARCSHDVHSDDTLALNPPGSLVMSCLGDIAG